MKKNVEELEALAQAYAYRWKGEPDDYRLLIQAVLADVLETLGEHCDAHQKHNRTGAEAKAFNDGVLCCSKTIMQMSSELRSRFSELDETPRMKTND